MAICAGMEKSMERVAIPPYEREVQYYETDQMQIVHHSNYIRWFEETRLHAMKIMGVPYDLLEEKGIIIPVLSASAVYRMAFRFGDVFSVRMKIVKFNGLKMEVVYEVYHKNTGILYTTGETSHAFLDRNMKPLRLKKEFPEIYEIFKNAVEEVD